MESPPAGQLDAALTRKQRETWELMGDGPVSVDTMARRMGVGASTAGARMRALVRQGVAYRARQGVYVARR